MTKRNSTNEKDDKKEPPPTYQQSEIASPPHLTPISSRSSISSQARIPTTKNVPYKPSRDQQRQIDILSGASTTRRESGGINTLQTSSTASETNYFDLLPSFEMFQSILKRDDRQFQEDLSTVPPIYGDTINSSSSSPRITPQQSIDQNLNEYGLEREHDRHLDQEYNFDEDPVGLSPVISSSNVNVEVHNENMAVTHETYGHSPLDNIDRLNRSTHSPIDLQIYVTKNIPFPNIEHELESRLKEYTSGDHVNGYVTVTNTSDEPVRFGLFTVSLEGTVKSTERNPNSFDFQHRYNKILMKKFLKMYDLNASYGYGYIPNSAGIEYEPLSRDKSDGSLLGIPDNRILQPKVKYKKFFTFKFPHRLLDNVCMNSILQHILPPPSMGIDRTSFFNRGESITMNKALGYGSLNLRGTPILTKDYSFDDLSIAYTIEAKFIDNVNSKDAVSHQEINDAKNDYVISKSAQYFLRFIPDLKEQVEYCKFHNVGNYPNIGVGGKFLEQLTYNLTWKSIKFENEKIEREIDQKLTKDELTSDMLKIKNLTLNDDEDELTKKGEDALISTNQPVEIFGKKKKMILSSLVKVGESRMSIKFPDKVIAYASPRLLMKYNDGEDNTLTPVTSNMEELYNRSEEDLLDYLVVDLSFECERDTKPPSMTIDTNIIIWSYKTEYPLPFEMGYDFFYKSHDKVPNDPVETTKRNLQYIKDQVSNYINFIKSNSIYISKDSFMYLKSIQKLGIKKDTIQHYFKTTVHEDKDWSIEQLPKGKFKWNKKIKIYLEVENKNNVNLLPTFQSCLVGRLYCLQVAVKYKGTNNDQNEFAHNTVKLDVPVLVG
ncbi:uncharacterized protein KGF55_001097 [Candida pseudojiufengensis]|uniref:uncharacterized protein n=1 Tax=Candida pseudojiufengensis TaxID=497109 RepID=UPI002224A903|nr:uncharacterized protein KGF55_001097 [Candida pseudojiufengensis]KAI5965734.1 hypothetical protein KGF55_001097 [Candida pseudojiufengensis]